MADGILFVDGFGHYTSAADKWSAYDSTPTVGASYGRNGGYGASLGGQDNLQLYLGQVYSHVILGFAVRFVTMVGTFESIAHFFGGGQYAHQFDVRLNRDGVISVYLNNGSSLLGSSAAGAFAVDGRWQYVEIRGKISESAGEVEVRVDGTSKLSITGVDTQVQTTGGIDWVRVGPWWLYGQSIGDKYVDDVVVINASVGTFLGDVSVETLLPSANSTVQWVASGPDNYDCVNDAAPDDDATYVSSDTINAYELYTFTDLVRSSGTVHGVQLNSTARITTAGVFTEIINTSATYDGTTHTSQTSYAPYYSIWGANPAGGAWTVSSINAATAGVRVIS